MSITACSASTAVTTSNLAMEDVAILMLLPELLRGITTVSNTKAVSRQNVLGHEEHISKYVAYACHACQTS